MIMRNRSIPSDAESTARVRNSVLRVARTSRAFTLLELLVVVTIIIVGTAVVVPAIGRVIESNNYAAAVNLVTGALGSARAEAIRTGRSTAVVFLFDIESETMTLQVCEQDGRESASLAPLSSGTNGSASYCRAYRPVVGTVPVELPRGTGVFGLSFLIAPGETTTPGNKIDDQYPTWHWYSGERLEEGSASPSNPEVIPWIFPRNDVRLFSNGTSEDIWNDEAISSPILAVRHCNTFMIQFDESGAVISSTSAGGVWTSNAYLELSDAPLRRDDPDAGPQDDPTVFDPEYAFTQGGGARDFTPNPEVVLRSAQQLAIVDLNRLGREEGIRSPWLVRAANARAPVADERIEPIYLNDDRVRAISQWIDLNGEILSFNRFTGQVLRRSQQQ
ncbi:MAG: hypothetical protein KDA20_01445 [Phycisphaerales bacterium]|nr:hypothetical protein [Phycisphaerales bacterium]